MAAQNPENTFPYLKGVMDLRVTAVAIMPRLLTPIADAVRRAGRGEMFNTTTEGGIQLYTITVPQRGVCVKLPDVFSHLGELVMSVFTHEEVFEVRHSVDTDVWTICLFDRF